MKTLEDFKSGPEMAQTKGSKISRQSKTHQDFWKSRLVRRTYADRKGHEVEMPEWHVRIAELGQRSWFNLETANQSAAAMKARDIYLSLVSAGWEATLAKYKPSAVPKADVCTVGEFIADVLMRSHLRPITVRRYAVKLRKMAADIAKLEVGLKGKALRSKFDYVNGGRERWLAKIEGLSMGLLTTEAVSLWRNQYVAKAGSDPIARKSAERSGASYIRAGRSLFTRDILPVLRVKLILAFCQ